MSFPFIFQEKDAEDDLDLNVRLNYTARQEFTDKYGGYIELIYTVCGGDLLNGFKKCSEMPADEFFFMAEYLTEKKYIENKEQEMRFKKKGV